jgi:hypothetical protein
MAVGLATADVAVSTSKLKVERAMAVDIIAYT